MFIKRVLLAILFLTIFLSNAFCEEKWDNLTGSIKDLDIKVIAQNPLDSNIVFTGSSKRLYKSVDAGKNWKEIFTVYGDGIIKFIAIDSRKPENIYLATSSGLFKTIDSGENWTKIFQDIGGEKGVLSVAVHPFDSDMIYLGTEQGLFNSKNSGKEWDKFSGEVSNAEINFIAVSPHYPDTLYAATSKGIYKTGDIGKRWERVFINTEGIEELPEEIETGEDNSLSEEESAKKVNCIAISFFDSNAVYAGTNYGIFMTKDSGKNWQRVSSAGLESNKINFIILSKKRPGFVCAATDRGVFRFDEKKNVWQKLYNGITANRVNALTFDVKEENLWAVGDGGVFNSALKNENSKETISDELSAIPNEPTVREIQEAAIKYAEVSPDKIKGWRKGAQFRSLFPELSVGYDKTVDYDSGSDKYYIGPYDWGLDFKWDLADLIWNPYQKDIDVRSRLMVQLRDDILDEVTHLYYERKRLQSELLNSPPQDPKNKIDKELRLQELTANIDGLTGGYFSQRLKEQR